MLTGTGRGQHDHRVHLDGRTSGVTLGAMNQVAVGRDTAPSLGVFTETFAESDQLACIACGQVELTGPQPRGVPCPGVVAWAMPLVERGPSGRWSALWAM